MLAIKAFHDPFAATFFVVRTRLIFVLPICAREFAEGSEYPPKYEAAHANKSVPSVLPNPSLRPHRIIKTLNPRISSVRQLEFASGELGHC